MGFPYVYVPEVPFFANGKDQLPGFSSMPMTMS
jgi:hypothetical protein